MTSDQTFATPMMKQYLKIKNDYPDCLLFFRLGDFYEMFLEDAKISSKVLGITLTQRSRGQDGHIPMAGVPYHAVDAYINKLVKAGYKVAICEQLSDPNEPGLVERGVVRIVTPGTVLDENALDKKQNNFVMSLCINENFAGLAAADISTGTLYTTELEISNLTKQLSNEFSKFDSAEYIVPNSVYENKHLLKVLKNAGASNIYPFEAENQTIDTQKKLLKEHFNVHSLKGFGMDENPQSVCATASLLEYLTYTQKNRVKHLKKPQAYTENKHLFMDRSTIVNLELLKTLREHEKKGSLINQIDETITAMGGRKLREWLLKPLTEKHEIEKRHVMVEFYVNDRMQREKVRNHLNEISDVERLLSRISVGVGNPRDLINLSTSLATICQIKTLLNSRNSLLEQTIKENIKDLDLKRVIKKVTETIVDEPPIDPKQGSVIKTNINLELDQLRNRIASSKSWITNLEKSERETTGIGSLKVRFNKVFGFYIEISKSNLDLVPKHYDRKQTLVNAERFITPELKNHEEIILTAEEQINKLEYDIFLQVVDMVVKQSEAIQLAAEAIATTDCIISFAHTAEMENYCKPDLVNEDIIEIIEGRHPVVEQLLDSYEFVPNDVFLNKDSGQLWLITGPNMAGKSVFIRQVALLVLMAQMGSFIPASGAKIKPVDKIFVRSGASDVITSGLSTFMVEMVETANILNNATSQSLIVMDEIGRGTSTYDGISIAWAIAEYLVSNQASIYPKTLFATHYHELEELEKHFPDKVENYQMAVEESEGEPIFLHRVVKGGAGYSFGIAVAKLAGVPKEVTQRAEEILSELETKKEKSIITGV